MLLKDDVQMPVFVGVFYDGDTPPTDEIESSRIEEANNASNIEDVAAAAPSKKDSALNVYFDEIGKNNLIMMQLNIEKTCLH